LATSIIVAGIALLAFASPALMVLRVVRSPPVMASTELWTAIDAIRQDSDDPVPTVLTDCGTGVLLPGLSGYRVLCGHWAMTENNRREIVLLSTIGFLADDASVPSFPDVAEDDVTAGARRLRAQIEDGTFQYLLVRKRFRIYESLERTDADCVLQNGSEYALLRMCGAVKDIVESTLASRVADRPAAQPPRS